MYLKEAVMVFTGLAAGGMVAAGTFAFIVMIGIFTRLAQRTRTSGYTSLFENAIILGGTLGNILFVYEIKLPFFYIGIVLFGFFSGIFVGCLAMALAEVLKIFPVFVKRVGLVEGIQYIVFSIAAGKCAGAVIQLFQLGG